MKFKKRDEHKARDRTQTNYISQEWESNVYPFPIIKSNISKEVKPTRTKEEIRADLKKRIEKEELKE